MTEISPASTIDLLFSFDTPIEGKKYQARAIEERRFRAGSLVYLPDDRPYDIVRNFPSLYRETLITPGTKEIVDNFLATDIVSNYVVLQHLYDGFKDTLLRQGKRLQVMGPWQTKTFYQLLTEPRMVPFQDFNLPWGFQGVRETLRKRYGKVPQSYGVAWYVKVLQSAPPAGNPNYDIRNNIFHTLIKPKIWSHQMRLATENRVEQEMVFGSK